jgi:hypothetical protein
MLDFWENDSTIDTGKYFGGKLMNKNESKIKDLYEGGCMAIWEDSEIVFLHILINGVTMTFPKEDWKQLRDELEEFINGEPNHHTAG